MAHGPLVFSKVTMYQKVYISYVDFFSIKSNKEKILRKKRPSLDMIGLDYHVYSLDIDIVCPQLHY